MNDNTIEAAKLIEETARKRMEAEKDNRVLYRKCENLWQTLAGVKNLLEEHLSVEHREHIKQILNDNNPSK